MEQVLPIFILLGIIIVAMALVLVGIFANARARQAQTPVDGMPPGEAASTPLASDSIAESIAVHLQPNGDVVLEIAGRRFRRMDDIRDNRLAARMRAAVAGVQRFVGITPTAQKPAALELTDELRIGHAPADRALVIELDGRRYRQLSDLPSEESRRQVLAMIGELTAFAQGLAVPAQTGQPATPAPNEFLKQLSTAASAPAPLKSYSLIESLRTPTPKPTPMPIGIAGQVEQILQQQLADNPTLRGWSIHIVTAPDGSLQLTAEGQSLPWPDGVPDGPVRDAVQKAIRTWEQTAGL